MIKAVIFDLDGTLLNTVEDIHIVLNESLQYFGLSAVSSEDTRKFLGNGAKKLVEKAVGECRDLQQRVYEYYALKFARCANEKTTLYDGAAEGLKTLKNAGIKLAIISNKPQDATNAVYAKYLAKFKFSEVLGQTEYYPLKPDPESTLTLMDKLKVKKDECVFVGDGETDVATAAAAGIKCISVLWGYRSRTKLEEVGAKIFAKNFSELTNLILS